ncbi:MAG: hypothetical protein WD271_05195 [Acidimicrobiia bacterium]
MKLVVLLVVVSVGLGAGRADAQTGGGELRPGYVRATARDLGAGSFPGGGLPARAPSVQSLFSWQRQASGMVCVHLAGGVPPELAGHAFPIPGPTAVTAHQVIGPGVPLVPPGVMALDDPALVPPGAFVVGDFVTEIGSAPNLVLSVPRCVRPGAPLLGEPPSPAEIWQETPLPRTAVHASPPGTPGWPGITRLATFFWGNAVPDTIASVSLRGFDVRVVAHPIAYAWSFGEGTTLVGPDPGSAGAPVPVTFLRRGNYVVELFVVWEGRARISFDGLELANQELGTVTLPERVPYHVAEIRAVLRTTPGRR